MPHGHLAWALALGVLPVVPAGDPCHLLSPLRGRQGFPTRTSHTCSAEASQSAAGRSCTGPASTGSWAEGQGQVPSAPGPARSARSAHRGHLRFLVDDVKEIHHH